jgi:hypothetical protein
MTYYHSPAYYRIRSIVRLAFWLGVSALVALATYLVLQNSPLLAENSKPECDLVINKDFTWDVSAFRLVHGDTDPNNCRNLDPIMVLSMDGSWDWATDK